MEAYEKMLEELYSLLEKVRPKKDVRWEPPSFKVIPEGRRTRISNFVQVCESLRRDPEFCRKWFTKECATPGAFQGGALVLQARLPSRFLQNKLQTFISKFVLCRECGRPDTRLEVSRGIVILHCEACGARYTVV